MRPRAAGKIRSAATFHTFRIFKIVGKERLRVTIQIARGPISSIRFRLALSSEARFLAFQAAIFRLTADSIDDVAKLYDLAEAHAGLPSYREALSLAHRGARLLEQNIQNFSKGFGVQPLPHITQEPRS